MNSNSDSNSDNNGTYIESSILHLSISFIGQLKTKPNLNDESQIQISKTIYASHRKSNNTSCGASSHFFVVCLLNIPHIQIGAVVVVSRSPRHTISSYIIVSVSCCRQIIAPKSRTADDSVNTTSVRWSTNAVWATTASVGHRSLTAFLPQAPSHHIIIASSSPQRHKSARDT